jgi:hypothetical protein
MIAAVASDIGRDPEHRDHELGDLGARVLLLAGDQPSVTDGEVPEQPALDEVGLLARFILDPGKA